MTTSASIGSHALIDAMLAGFSGLPDLHQGRNKQYRVEDALMSTFSLFFMQSSSFLQYQRQMATQKGRSNARSLFRIEQMPCDYQIRLNHQSRIFSVEYHKSLRAILKS